MTRSIKDAWAGDRASRGSFRSMPRAVGLGEPEHLSGDVACLGVVAEATMPLNLDPEAVGPGPLLDGKHHVVAPDALFGPPLPGEAARDGPRAGLVGPGSDEEGDGDDGDDGERVQGGDSCTGADARTSADITARHGGLKGGEPLTPPASIVDVASGNGAGGARRRCSMNHAAVLRRASRILADGAGTSRFWGRPFRRADLGALEGGLLYQGVDEPELLVRRTVLPDGEVRQLLAVGRDGLVRVLAEERVPLVAGADEVVARAA